MDNDYEIGYGKPPASSQFKPGESGNKKGRPRGSKNTYTLLNEILNQKITIKENGKALKMSKKSAMLIQLINKGVKGDTKAISILFPHLLEADMKEEERNAVMTALSSDDQEILNVYLSKLQTGNYADEQEDEDYDSPES
jgi:hypothetical protein